MKNRKTKRDLILVLVILVIAGGFYAANLLINRKPPVIVEVSIDGKITEELDLRKDTELVLQSSSGGTNTLIIKDGAAYISHATCPDKICIHQGKISKSGEMIVCLPNRLIVKIVGETD